MIGAQNARKLVLLSQGIHRAGDFGRGESAIRNVVERLGYIQIDTISVVERAHHHVLWSRAPWYKPRHLESLVAKRKLYEYWSHAAAYLPIRDYRYSLIQKNAIKAGDSPWGGADPKSTKFVLERITAEGPLQARDFVDTRPARSSGWWDWKPAKKALEFLFMSGELMISERRGFQKVFDLPERVLPNGLDLTTPTLEEFSRHLILRYLAANAIGTAAHISYLRRGMKSLVNKTCQQLVEEGELVEVNVKGIDFYAQADIERALTKPLSRQQVKILSPFDNLLIQRKRMQLLFDFDYQIECYVPAAKRVYGYFALPLLWGQVFAGRMDAKIDRSSGILTVKHLSIETQDCITFLEALIPALRDFLRFNGGKGVKVGQISSPIITFSSETKDRWVKMLERL